MIEALPDLFWCEGCQCFSLWVFFQPDTGAYAANFFFLYAGDAIDRFSI